MRIIDNWCSCSNRGFARPMSVILLSLFSFNCLNLKYEALSLHNLEINNACTEKVLVTIRVGCNTYPYSYSQTVSVTLRACIFQGGFCTYCITCTCYSFLFCPIVCLYGLSSVLWCPLPALRFPYKNKMFVSSLPPVVCKRTHVLFTSFVFVWV